MGLALSFKGLGGLLHDTFVITASSHGVLSLTYVNKSQLLSLKSSLRMSVWFAWFIWNCMSDFCFMSKKPWDLCCGLGRAILLDPIHNTSSWPHLQKVMPWRHPCRIRTLGLGTLCEPALTVGHICSSTTNKMNIMRLIVMGPILFVMSLFLIYVSIWVTWLTMDVD